MLPEGSSEKQPATMTEAAVSLKLPVFWPQQPEVWFAQTEAQFAIRGISTEETKFQYTVSALDQETAVRVLDVIKKMPAKTPYTTLKGRLLGTFTPSEYERAGQLLHMPPLGDHKPSYLMDQMLGLMPAEHEPCFLFRRLYLEKLPERIRSILLHSDIQDMRELATAADKLHDSFSGEVSSATISKISQKPDKKDRKPKRNSDSRERSDYCFYHARFGKKAHKCEQPCAWTAENSQAGPQ